MTAPERIWLERDPLGWYDTIRGCRYEPDPADPDPPPDGYVEYVRADLYDAAVTERDAARAEVERLRPVVEAAVAYRLAWDDTRAATEAWMRTGIPHVEERDLKDAEKTLYQAVTAYRAAKEKTP